MVGRRNMLIGLGTVIAGGGTVIGTGAFSTVTAKRTVSIETAGDANALLQITANKNYGRNAAQYITTADYNLMKTGTSTTPLVSEYVTTTDNGTIKLTFDKINRNAVTRFDHLLRVRNQGIENINAYVHNGDGEHGQDPIYGNGYGSSGPMDVLKGDNYVSGNDTSGTDSDSIVGGNDQQLPNGPLSLTPGESALLTIIIDTRSTGAQSWESGKMKIIANSA